MEPLQRHIYKAQRPISSTDDEPPWLVYREGKPELIHMEPTHRMVEFMGDDLKMHARGYETPTRLVVEERLEDQPL